MRREGFYAKRKPFRRAVRARGVAHKIHRFEFYAVDQQEGGVDFEVIPTSISANPSPPTPDPSHIERAWMCGHSQCGIRRTRRDDAVCVLRRTSPQSIFVRITIRVESHKSLHVSVVC